MLRANQGAPVSTPLTIEFRGLPDVEGIHRCARLELDKLAHLHPRIESCRLTMEVRSGNKYHGGAWVVQLTVCVPGAELTTDHDSGFIDDQESPLVTVRAAFVGARRLLLADAKRIRKLDQPADIRLARPAA
jgi:hypothetical protein